MSRIKGMTLLEMMLAAALVGLVGLTFAAIYGSVQRYFIQDVNFTYTQGEAGYAMQHLQRNVLPGLEVRPFPPPVNPLTDSFTRFSFRYDTLGFEFPSADTDDRWAGYWLNGTTLMFTPEIRRSGAPVRGDQPDPTETEMTGSPSEIIARGVNTFQCMLPSAALMRVTVSVTQGTGGNARTSSITSSFSPRGTNPVP